MTRRLLKLTLKAKDPKSIRVQDIGRLLDRRPAEPAAGDFPVIAPGKSWTYKPKPSFPGMVGGNSYALLKPGQYRLRLSYTPSAEHRPATPLAEGCWTGSIASNEIGLDGHIAMGSLGNPGTGIVDADELARFITMLQDKKRPYRDRQDIMRSLSKTEKPEAKAALLGLVKDRNESPRIHRAAIGGLLHFKGDDIDPAIIEALKSPSDQVVKEAVKILGWRKSALAVPALCELVSRPKKTEASYRAVVALGEIADGRAAPVLQTQLQTPREAWRIEGDWKRYLAAVRSALKAIAQK